MQTNTQITMKLSDNAFTRALAKADEAHWVQDDRAFAHWTAVAQRIARFCQFHNIPY